MERSYALKRLSKMLGKNFGYRIDPDAPSPEARAAAKEAQAALNVATDAAAKAAQQRVEYLLSTDAEYQRLKAVAKEAREAANRNAGILHTHKITVGTSNSLFFSVHAQGDSWEEIFRELDRKKAL